MRHSTIKQLNTILITMLTAANLLLTKQARSQQTFCNPLNISYRFQSTKPSRRTAADPVIILYKDNYYLFATASGRYWYSTEKISYIVATRYIAPLHLPFEALIKIKNIGLQ